MFIKMCNFSIAIQPWVVHTYVKRIRNLPVLFNREIYSDMSNAIQNWTVQINRCNQFQKCIDQFEIMLADIPNEKNLVEPE